MDWVYLFKLVSLFTEWAVTTFNEKCGVMVNRKVGRFRRNEVSLAVIVVTTYDASAQQTKAFTQ